MELTPLEMVELWYWQTENGMMSTYEVLQQAKALKPSERKELLRLLQEVIAVDDGQKPKRSLRELRGLGKEIWQGIDAQEYINELRAEWKERDR
ncbi:MAG: hypothetical protein OXI77_15210 [Chloroflexota bacterium]|nr:hypothetical protein [Chloroflexota bacterium]MDE2910290.1 hypothetical protein [Chloroflexota bacterium]